MKKVIVSVINDLSHDQRVHKVCISLQQEGFEVELVGRRRRNSEPIKRDYSTHRMYIGIEKGPFFYAFFTIRLFFFLLFKRADVLHANDLDTLLPNYLASKLRGIPLVYDSHEYFTGVPEIQHRKLVKWVWVTLERLLFPRLKYVFTVNDSIAELYKSEYGKAIHVMRNIPTSSPLKSPLTKEQLGLPMDKRILILQGAGINVDRGAEELLESVALSNDYFLIIAGSGDVIEALQHRAHKSDLLNKVLFTGKLPYVEMMQYTQCADVGLTLDKPLNINYQLSLPNKLFDYIKANVPVVSSDLVELKKIIQHYQIGAIIPSHEPLTILNVLDSLFDDEGKLTTMKANTKLALEQLSWENEVLALVEIYRQWK
jgi:glycosyltransferase involved in cell wall biosynthesis